MIEPNPLPHYLDPTRPVSERVEDLLGRMDLAEKIGQMTLVAAEFSPPERITEFRLGAVLSGGDGAPPVPSPAGWSAHTRRYQEAALATRLKIPILYGIDAVHGNAKMAGATVFPHNIGLGASGDENLLEAIGRATALECAATGANWVYAPVLAVPQDVRWGRTYEAFGQDPALVARLGTAFLRGLQGAGLGTPGSVLATPKHFVGDGGTAWGSPVFTGYRLDQGDTRLDEADLRRIHLAPYLPAIESGALSIMVSFSSWNGLKMHAHRYLLTDVLKGELGFRGFLVSDWDAVRQVSEDYDEAVVRSIDAGIDMNMISEDFAPVLPAMHRAVEAGQIDGARIDDAVRRILTAKFEHGLFERPFADEGLIPEIGSPAHRSLARESVRRSLVLLVNAAGALPLSRAAGPIYVAGQGADDLGLQCGGWTMTWQGGTGPTIAGTSLLDAVRAAAGPDTEIIYDPEGLFAGIADRTPAAPRRGTGLVVLAERPYAEGLGDVEDLALSAAEIDMLHRMRALAERTVVILFSGRPRIITEALPHADAWVAAWLPGPEGAGIADVLFGDVAFTGRLSFEWPAAPDQVPLGAGAAPPLFAIGHGLSIGST